MMFEKSVISENVSRNRNTRKYAHIANIIIEAGHSTCGVGIFVRKNIRKMVAIVIKYIGYKFALLHY